MSPRIKDKKIAMTWTRKETSQLIHSIKAQLKKRDPLPYSRRISVLNWEKISIPQKSIKECKSYLGTVIKKIHRIRTLEEILSVVDVEPIQIGGDISEINIVNRPIDNNNSPAELCYKRRSKRLSEANERHDLLKYSQSRSQYSDRLIVLAKHNPAKRTNKQSDDDFTDDDVLLHKYRQEKSDAIDSGKENNPSNNRKRKLEDDEDAIHFLRKKKRKLEHNPADCPTDGKIEKPIDAEFTVHNVAVVNESNTDEIDQSCSSSASGVSMFSSTPVNEIQISDNDNTRDEFLGDLAADLVYETTAIDQLSCISTNTPNNSNNSVAKINLIAGTIESEELSVELTEELDYFSDDASGSIKVAEHCETSVKSEDESRIEEVGDKTNHVVKEEVTESPRVFSRIRTIWAGLFYRLTGYWMVKRE